jgi:hypothetical protein
MRPFRPLGFMHSLSLIKITFELGIHTLFLRSKLVLLVELMKNPTPGEVGS